MPINRIEAQTRAWWQSALVLRHRPAAPPIGPDTAKACAAGIAARGLTPALRLADTGLATPRPVRLGDERPGAA